MPIRQVLVVPLFATVALAQVNPFVFYPQDPERQTVSCTSFVGRPDVANAGEALMVIDTDHLRGVGDANGLIFLFGVYHWVADEKLSTPETYDVLIRTAAVGGPGPDTTPAGEVVRITGLSTPPSSNPNRGTWIVNDGFGGPVMLPAPLSGFTPGEGRYYVGVDLPANPLWPTTDGHSLFRADLLNAGTGATVGENHRAGVPDPTWAVTPTTTFTTPWTYILGPLVTSPNLHIGGIDPTSNRLGLPTGQVGANLSMNGLYPDLSGLPRQDGLMFRITDNLAPFGVVLLGGNFGFKPPYYEWSLQGTLIGHGHIVSGSMVALGFTALQVGVTEVQVGAPGTLAPSLMGQDVAFQAIVWDLNNSIAEWTNAQVVHL